MRSPTALHPSSLPFDKFISRVDPLTRQSEKCSLVLLCHSFLLRKDPIQKSRRENTEGMMWAKSAKRVGRESGSMKAQCSNIWRDVIIWAREAVRRSSSCASIGSCLILSDACVQNCCRPPRVRTSLVTVVSAELALTNECTAKCAGRHWMLARRTFSSDLDKDALIFDTSLGSISAASLLEEEIARRVFTATSSKYSKFCLSLDTMKNITDAHNSNCGSLQASDKFLSKTGKRP
mmetsp:Transcript_21838/g.36143  ORF Transcript_21838/g.36143 Transcript_21838/m.36143 type:complete len:235 (-) Transcript_21838:760-1464(-)